MQSNQIEVLETNRYVTLYKGDIFRTSVTRYEDLLDEKTRKEHLRQLERL